MDLTTGVKVLKPASAEEVSAALAAASRDRLTVGVLGGGTRIDRNSLRCDLVIDLSGLDRVIEYEPEDFTLTAQCGCTLDSLRQTLLARGQELPLESAHATRATLGGTLATNGSGPRRLRFGAPRDRILGATIALADGTRIRSGGKVVKNVAGFALHRLMCGAGGRWGIILEASLKLAPAPEARAAVLYGASAADLANRDRWRFLARLEPSFATVLGRDAARALAIEPAAEAGFVVAIGLEDDAAWVAEQERTIRDHLGEPATRIEGDAVSRLVQSLADAEGLDLPRSTFTSAHNTPAALAPLLSLDAAPRLVFHAPAGRLHWFPETATADPGGFAGHGFTRIGGRRTEAAGDDAPAESALPALRARIREALDPLGVLQVPPF